MRPRSTEPIETIPAPHERLSLQQAGLLFDPPRSRRALDQLIRRGVLQGWHIDGRVWTTVEALRRYAENAKHSPRLRDVSSVEAELRARIAVLEDVIRQMEHTITELRIAVAETRAGTWQEGSTPRPENAIEALYGPAIDLTRPGVDTEG